MHADEADIDTPLVRGLLDAQFPALADRPLTRIESAGTVNAIYRLGEDLAVRLPLVADGESDLARELRWLPRLAPHLPAAIPAPVAVGTPALGYPYRWSVLHWLDGVNPDPDDLVDPERLAADLAGFIAALRGIDTTGAQPSARGEPLADRDTATRTAIAELTGMIDTAAATTAWEDALAAEPWSGPPVWLHGDFSPGNVLVAGGRLTAVIDFGCVGVGEPAVDLICAWNLLPARVRPALRASVGVDDATWRRARGWALSISLIQLPYYRVTNPALATNSRHVIDQILRSE